MFNILDISKDLIIYTLPSPQHCLVPGLCIPNRVAILGVVLSVAHSIVDAVVLQGLSCKGCVTVSQSQYSV